MALINAHRSTDSGVVDQQSALAFRINNFDLIRLFAAVQVAIFHAYSRFELPVPAAFVPLGWFQGVPIFFVISGFLISGSLDRQASLVRYARNRALRIFPGLWACLALTVVVATLCGFTFLSPSALAWLALQTVGVIYTPGFLDAFGDGTYNGSLWTIPLELQFYTLLPLLYWLTSAVQYRIRWIALCLMLFLIIGCIVKLALPTMATADETPAIKLLRYTFVPRFYLFLIGVLLQRLHAHRVWFIRGKGLHWFVGYCAVQLVVPQVGLMYVVDEILLGVTVIALAYSAPTVSERLLRGNDISYGVYLYHGLIITAMIELSLPGSLMTVLGASTVLAIASWLLIERPAMRLKHFQPGLTSQSAHDLNPL